MVLTIWRFWKKVSRKVDFGRWRQTVGLGSDHDGEKLGSDYEGEKLGSYHDGEKLGSDHGAEKLRLDHVMCWTFWGVVSIVWLRKTFKYCLSPCVEEPKSGINKRFVPEQQRVCLILLLYLYCVVCIYIRVIYNTSYTLVEATLKIFFWLS